MSLYDTLIEKCPYCNSECEADWVDNGIGLVQCGPYYCTKCGASEIGLYDDIGFKREIVEQWYEENYKLEEQLNGKFVNHKVAKQLYDYDLLDKK